MNESISNKKSISNILRRLHVVHLQKELMRNVDTDAAWESVTGKIRVRHRRRVALRACGVAAAVAMVVCAGAWLVPGSLMPKQPIALETSMVKNRAFITLSDCAPIEVDGGEYTIQRDDAGRILYENRHGELILHRRVELSGINTVATAKGSSFVVVMDDGTRITLGSDSRLSYPRNAANRVELTGEALFDVARQSKGRFVVKCSDGVEVAVMGTVFNIRSYPGTPTAVTLESGKIMLKSNGGSTMLRPDQQAVVQGGELKSVKEVDADVYTSWASGIYEFDNVELRDIMTALSLWYEVDINFADPELESRKFTGVILRNMTLKDTLELIKTVSGIRFKQDGGAVIIYKD